jgi:hypothetical protein
LLGKFIGIWRKQRIAAIGFAPIFLNRSTFIEFEPNAGFVSPVFGLDNSRRKEIKL